MIDTAISLSTRGHFRILKSGHFNFLLTREFNDHQTINKALDCDSYFAKPYHSWERGLNENFNGLLRQYFPKGMAFDQLNQEEVCAAVNEMNHRPRKSLGFMTPWEVFAELVQKNTKTKPLVALMT